MKKTKGIKYQLVIRFFFLDDCENAEESNDAEHDEM